MVMHSKSRKIISLVLSFCFLFQQASFAQVAAELNLSSYFSKVGSSLTQEKFRPLHLRYFSYDNASDNFKVLLDKGDALKGLSPNDNQEVIKGTVPTLLNYFLVGVSLPDSFFWVNLRPDAQDQIIDPALEKTDIGKIMLEADLQLKKDTAALTSPRTTEGKAYWAKLYKKAAELYGNDNTSIPTLTRPWIVPGEVIVRETKDSAYVYKAGLKVMLEQDYLKDSSVYNFPDARSKALNEYSSQLIRELIIPKLTRDVNSAKRYSALRQVYYSLILSRWFKLRFTGKEGTYSKLINTANLANLTSSTSWSKSTYFNAYKKSFADGEYNISEPVSTPSGQVIRTYFSGGIQIGTGSINTQNGISSTSMRLPGGLGIMQEGNAGREVSSPVDVSLNEKYLKTKFKDRKAVLEKAVDAAIKQVVKDRALKPLETAEANGVLSDMPDYRYSAEFKSLPRSGIQISALKIYYNGLDGEELVYPASAASPVQEDNLKMSSGIWASAELLEKPWINGYAHEDVLGVKQFSNLFNEAKIEVKASGKWNLAIDEFPDGRGKWPVRLFEMRVDDGKLSIIADQDGKADKVEIPLQELTEYPRPFKFSWWDGIVYPPCLVVYLNREIIQAAQKRGFAAFKGKTPHIAWLVTEASDNFRPQEFTQEISEAGARWVAAQASWAESGQSPGKTPVSVQLPQTCAEQEWLLERAPMPMGSHSWFARVSNHGKSWDFKVVNVSGIWIVKDLETHEVVQMSYVFPGSSGSAASPVGDSLQSGFGNLPKADQDDRNALDIYVNGSLVRLANLENVNRDQAVSLGTDVKNLMESTIKELKEKNEGGLPRDTIFSRTELFSNLDVGYIVVYQITTKGRFIADISGKVYRGSAENGEQVCDIKFVSALERDLQGHRREFEKLKSAWMAAITSTPGNGQTPGYALQQLVKLQEKFLQYKDTVFPNSDVKKAYEEFFTEVGMFIEQIKDITSMEKIDKAPVPRISENNSGSSPITDQEVKKGLTTRREFVMSSLLMPAVFRALQSPLQDASGKQAMETISAQLKSADERYYAQMRRLIKERKDFSPLKVFAETVGAALLEIFNRHADQVPELQKAMDQWEKEGKLVRPDSSDLAAVLQNYYARFGKYFDLESIDGEFEGIYLPGFYQMTLADRVASPGGEAARPAVPGAPEKVEEIAIGEEQIVFNQQMVAYSISKPWGAKTPRVVYRTEKMRRSAEEAWDELIKDTAALTLPEAINLIKEKNYGELNRRVFNNLLRKEFAGYLAQGKEKFIAKVMEAQRKTYGTHEFAHLAEPEGKTPQNAAEAFQARVDEEASACWQEMGYSGYPYFALRGFLLPSLLPDKRSPSKSAAKDLFDFLQVIIQDNRDRLTMIDFNEPKGFSPEEVSLFYFAQFAELPRNMLIAAGKMPIGRESAALAPRTGITSAASPVDLREASARVLVSSRIKKAIGNFNTRYTELINLYHQKDTNRTSFPLFENAVEALLVNLREVLREEFGEYVPEKITKILNQAVRITEKKDFYSAWLQGDVDQVNANMQSFTAALNKLVLTLQETGAQAEPSASRFSGLQAILNGQTDPVSAGSPVEWEARAYMPVFPWGDGRREMVISQSEEKIRELLKKGWDVNEESLLLWSGKVRFYYKCVIKWIDGVPEIDFSVSDLNPAALGGVRMWPVEFEIRKNSASSSSPLANNAIPDFWSGQWSRVPSHFVDANGWFPGEYPFVVHGFILGHTEAQVKSKNKKVRIIDLGSGANLYLAREIQESFIKHGLDAEIHALDPAKEEDVRRLSTAKNIIYHSGKMEDPSIIPSGSMDIVVSAFALDYTDMRASLEQIDRMLSQDGRAFLILHHPKSDSMDHADKYLRDVQRVNRYLHDLLELLTKKTKNKDIYEIEREISMVARLNDVYQKHITRIAAQIRGYIYKDNSEESRKKLIEEVGNTIAIVEAEIASNSRLLDNLFRNESWAKQFFVGQGFDVEVTMLEETKDYDGDGYFQVPEAYGVVLTKRKTGAKKKESSASPVTGGDKETGGIDFRSFRNLSVQPMGSFKGLNLRLPQLSRATLERIDLDAELRQLRNMIAGGNIPSSQRIKELIAACVQKGRIDAYADSLFICLADICKLQEEDASESSPELKEALLLVDLQS